MSKKKIKVPPRKPVRKAAALDASVGSYLRGLRKSVGLRQIPAARIMGLDQAALSRIENGKQALTAAQWVLFSRALGLRGDRLSRNAVSAFQSRTLQ